MSKRTNKRTSERANECKHKQAIQNKNNYNLQSSSPSPSEERLPSSTPKLQSRKRLKTRSLSRRFVRNLRRRVLQLILALPALLRDVLQLQQRVANVPMKAPSLFAPKDMNKRPCSSQWLSILRSSGSTPSFSSTSAFSSAPHSLPLRPPDFDRKQNAPAPYPRNRGTS